MGQALDNGIKQVFPYSKATGFNGLRLDGAGATKQRLDADDEFLHPEGLFQVIVGAHLKAMYYVNHC